MRGCRRGADSATAGRCEGADSAAADQRGGVAHLQAQRVHARLPPAAAGRRGGGLGHRWLPFTAR